MDFALTETQHLLLDTTNRQVEDTAREVAEWVRSALARVGEPLAAQE